MGMRESITLDNASTLSLFCSPDLVEDIASTTSTLELMTNAGSRRSNQQATVPGFGQFWFDPKAIANIFGFADLVKKHWITYDSDKEDAFLVHMPNKIVKFKSNAEGLYQFQVPQEYRSGLKKHQVSHIMDTVEENKSGFSQRQFERAKIERKLYHVVGSPTVEAFKAILKGNVIRNCPVTSEDVYLAQKIFGPAISALKGKTTRQTPKVVVSDEIAIPPELISKN